MVNNQYYHTTFSKEFLSKLIDAVSLSDLISNDLNIQLKKSGKNYWLCCPFHDEKTPSFIIKDNKYHCFGCSISGNAITWLRAWRKLSFYDAVIKLSNISKIPVPDAKIKTNDNSIPEINLLININHFYTYKIKQEKKIFDFLLNDRGLSLDTVYKYNLGLVTSGICSLLQEKYLDNLLIESGLFVRGTNDKLKDLLKYRITIPIFNEQNQIVNFSGRRFPNISNYPKYINGQENSFFQKGQILYGLNFSKKHIQKLNTVYVVEGYFDHILLSQNNVNNSVATMGTAITQFQLDKIFSLADNIIFCFDSDSAGVKAALKVAYMCLRILSDNKNISFILLPDNHDPDSFIRKNGIDCWNEESERKISLSTFIINDLISSNHHNPTNIESNVNIAVNALNIIDSINSDAIFYKKAFKIGIEDKIGFKL
jgi:DNA primase